MHRDLVPLYEYHYLEQKREAGKISSSKVIHTHTHTHTHTQFAHWYTYVRTYMSPCLQRTERYLKPECMGTSFFWWSYDGKYERRAGSSQYNNYEIEMVVSLCSWLVCNRVNGKDIAVLTPYRGQVKTVWCNEMYFTNCCSFFAAGGNKGPPGR